MTYKPNCYAITEKVNGEGYRIIGAGWAQMEARREGVYRMKAELGIANPDWKEGIENSFKVIKAAQLSDYNLTEEDYDPDTLRKELEVLRKLANKEKE